MRRTAADEVLADLRDPVCRWLADTTLTFANPAYCEMFGVSHEQLIGHRLLAAAAQVSGAETIIHDVLATLTPAAPLFAYEHCHAAADGPRWVLWNSRGLFDEDGTLREVQSIGRDVTDSKRVLALSQDSEARYRLLAEHSHDAIVRLALDGTCLYVSPAFRLLTGCAPEEILGCHPSTLCHPDDWPGVAQELKALFASPDGIVVSCRVRHRQRDWVWSESTIRPVRDAAGDVVEFILVGRDISERKARDAALRVSEQRLDLALAAADMGLWDLDLDAGTLMHDARWAAQLGYTVAEVNPLPMPWQRMVHPDDMPAVQERLSAHLRGETPFYVSEHRLRTKDGEWRWMHLRGQVVGRDAQGWPRRLLGLQRDIHDRVRADEALRTSETELRALIESVPDAVSVTDLDGMLLYRNRPRSGRAGEVLGRRFYDLAAPEYRAPLRDAFRRAVASGTTQEVEMRRVGVDNSVRWYLSRMTPIVRDGAARVVTLITSEVTAQREREEHLLRFNAELEARVNARTAELQASLRELESFSYSVSHDLRAPLRAIDGFSQALVEDYGARLDAQGLDYLARVRGAAQRMGELIDDLLGLARVMRKDLSYAPVAIGRLAREVANEIACADPQRRVAVLVDDTLLAIGDAVLLRAALANLLGNAWKFTRESSNATIEFGADMRGGERVFYVRDTGVGFDMAYAAKLFQPFQRLHEPGEFEGSGIGLATVQRIIGRHGGWIWGESEPGCGATFFFTLPELA
ncbi:MAG: PAS domain S-box protein [bacterium]